MTPVLVFDIESIPEEHRSLIEQPRMVDAAVAKGAAGSVLFVTNPAVTTSNVASSNGRSATSATRASRPAGSRAAIAADPSTAVTA